jgi:putative DNA primase/helicase
VKNWADECTERDPQAEAASSKLFASWKLWCDDNGERPGTSKAFSQRLTDLGLTSKHTRAGTVFFGIRMGV